MKNLRLRNQTKESGKEEKFFLLSFLTYGPSQNSSREKEKMIEFFSQTAKINTIDKHPLTRGARLMERPIGSNDSSLQYPVLETKSHLRFWFFVFGILCFSVLAAALPACAEEADHVAFQSPYVWRLDEAGDFVLPAIAEKMEYVSKPISVDETVTSITVNWDATGPVAVFVSADGGSHYTRAVNGVPLTKDLTKGSTLKWKAILGEDAQLKSLALDFISKDIKGNFGRPELSGFSHRKEFKVSGPSEGSLYNYQVRIRVAESSRVKGADVPCEKMMSDFKDIRFTLPDGQTLLPYALMGIEGKKPDRIATFFVKVPQIPVGGIMLFVYYGAPAESLSSPKDTFDFYEDFTQGAALDPDKWIVSSDPGGSAKTGKDGLLLDAATVTAKNFEYKQGVLEFLASAETGYEIRLVARDPDPASSTDLTLVAYSSGLKDAEHAIVVDNIIKKNDSKPLEAGALHGFRLTADKNNLLTFERLDENFSEIQASTSYEDKQGPAKGHPALKTTGLGLGRSLSKIRWIRARKITFPEPAIDPASVGSEEVVSLPIFSNVGIDQKGNLILLENAKLGEYVVPAIKTNFDIRILVFDGKGDVVIVAMAADGKNYKKNCKKGTYYYAAKGDFPKGKDFSVRLEFLASGDKKGYAENMSFAFRPGNIFLMEPNGGDLVGLGSKKDIRWTAWDYDKAYPMVLSYSLDNGKAWTVISANAPNTGSFEWVVPKNTALLTKEALIRIVDSYDEQVSDASDKPFSIVPGSMKPDEEEEILAPARTGEKKADEIKAQKEKEVLPVDPTLEEIIEKGHRPGTELYDIAVKLVDTVATNPIEDARSSSKEGDIVMVLPAGHEWSQTEREAYLIIQAYLSPQEAGALKGTIVSGRIRKVQKIDLKKFGLPKDVRAREERLEKIREYLQERPLDTEEIVGESQRQIPSNTQAALMKFQARLSKMATDIANTVQRSFR